MSLLSCIIIARNQVYTIVNCIESIFISLETSSINNYEIIYIDSSSTDNTITVLKERFDHTISIYQISGAMNAPIARNTGASLSKGDTLFFIDGDMVVNKYFMKEVYSNSDGLKYDAVSGKLSEQFYDSHWNKCTFSEDRYNIKRMVLSSDLGGIFFIKKEIFIKLNGFKSHLLENEDMDFIFRLRKKKFTFYRIPHQIATHHTINYDSYSRIFTRFLKGNHLYDGVLYRENITNFYCIKTIIKHQRFLAILLISITAAFILSIWFLLLYPFFIILKYLLNRKVSLLETFISTLLRDISGITGFFFFFPDKKLSGKKICKKV
jgi:glycosyltransferase involved in cell wall biosynthesis